MRPPLTFRTPSIVSDTPQARAKVKRDLEQILREAGRYLEPGEILRLARKVANARKGNTADGPLNHLLLAEYDAAAAKGPVNIPEFSRGFYERHGRRQSAKRGKGQSAKAVEKRLRRLLKDRKRKDERDRKLKAALQRPSLIGTR